MANHSVKGILFDLDGVLVDACNWHFLALNLALKEHAGIQISKKDHKTTYNGLPTKTKLEMLGISDSVKDAIWESKQTHTIKLIQENLVISTEMTELFRYLKQCEYKLGCVTNSIRLTASLMLLRVGVLDYLDVLITNEDVDNPKPAPDGYLKAMQSLNLSPWETLIVEDSPKGVEAAASTGARILNVVNSTEICDILNVL